MSAVVGIDLSTRAIDLVKLSEDTNAAEWVRCELEGNGAWARTLGIREAMWDATGDSLHRWLDDVYLVAIEAPYGRRQDGTNAILNRVVGAVAASLPARLRTPERCWVVRPDEYRTPLGLNAKPSAEDIERIAPGATWTNVSGPMLDPSTWQNAYDAFALALWARDTNAEAVTAALAGEAQ